MQVLAPAAIIYLAKNDFQEFNGLRAAPFPGQEKPQPIQFAPNREQFKHCKETKVGTKTPMLPRNTFQNHRRIVLDVHTQDSAAQPKQCTRASTSHLPVDLTMVIVE